MWGRKGLHPPRSNKIITPPLSTRSLLERIDFSGPFVILIQKSNLTSKTRIWTWRRRKKVLTLAPQKAAMSGEFGAARLGFSKYALILAISNEKTGFQGPKFSVLRPPPPLGQLEARFLTARGCGADFKLGSAVKFVIVGLWLRRTMNAPRAQPQLLQAGEHDHRCGGSRRRRFGRAQNVASDCTLWTE